MIEPDGKAENAQHVLALDPFTLAALKEHVAMLDRERAESGPDDQDMQKAPSMIGRGPLLW